MDKTVEESKSVEKQTIEDFGRMNPDFGYTDWEDQIEKRKIRVFRRQRALRIADSLQGARNCIERRLGDELKTQSSSDVLRLV